MALKTTRLTSCILQSFILSLYLKDTKKSNEATEIAVDIMLKKDDLPKALKKDLFNLIGRKILDLNNLDVNDEKINMNSSSSLIVQSSLISGGL